MKIKFQADADFNQIILNATIRSEPLIDFQSAVTAGLEGISDEDVLALAAKSGRVLVTHDQSTMPTHFANFITTKQSAGVLIVPQHIPFSVVADELILIWLVTEPEEWINRIAYLPL